MIYIGFSTSSHKLYARIFCKKYRHCAPVLVSDKKCIIYQFVNRKKISQIHVRHRDIKKLEHYGWKFIKYDGKFAPEIALNSKPLTCVQFTKQTIGIKKMTLQTPDALLKFLTRKRKSL